VTHPHSDPLDALRLRRWALEGLTTATASPPPAASNAGWSLFLGREACAVRLLPRVPGPPPPPLGRKAEEELQRILLLRLELDAVLKVAAALGLRPIILKGGAALHDPARAVPARDLDLLLPYDEARALLTGMERAGWEPQGRGPAHHFADRIRPGGIPVEVHPAQAGSDFGLEPAVVDRAVPHPAYPDARLLAPADQIRHLAYHQTIQHSSHRGRLRDLLLLADALGTTSAPPEPRVWQLPRTELPPLTTTLVLAERVARMTPGDDPTEETAVLWYLLDAETTHAPRTGIGRLAARWTFDLAAGDASTTRRWRLMSQDQFDTRSSLLIRAARFLVLPFVLLIATRRLSRLRSAAAKVLAAAQGTKDTQ
jgi:hypothetical protein